MANFDMSWLFRQIFSWFSLVWVMFQVPWSCSASIATSEGPAAGTAGDSSVVGGVRHSSSGGSAPTFPGPGSGLVPKTATRCCCCPAHCSTTRLLRPHKNCKNSCNYNKMENCAAISGKEKQLKYFPVSLLYIFISVTGISLRASSGER